MNDEKIKLYAVRDFGQRLTVVMDFTRQNWKPMLLYLTYFLLPLSLVQGLSLNSFMGGYMDLISGMTQNAENPSTASIVAFVLNLLAFFGLYIVGAVLMYAVVFGLMRLYERGDGNLSAMTWKVLKPDFMLSLKRSIILMLVGFVFGVVVLVLLSIIIGLAVLVTPALAILAYFALILVLVFVGPPVSLITPAYVFEDQTTLMASIRKGLRLGFGTYWGTVGVIMILGFIINIVTQFVSMPWAIMFFVKALFGLGLDGLDASWTENVFYTFVYYLAGVLECFGGYVASAGLVIGTAYLYGHAAEKLDGITVESNIRNFENL